MWQFRIFSVLFLSGFHLAASKSSLRYPNSQPDPTACQCVPSQDCLHGDFELQNTCQKYSDVCCAPASISNSKRQPRSSDPCDIGQRNDENMGNPETPTTANPGVLAKCGLSNPGSLGPTHTVERTDEAKFGEFPWMVAIFYPGKNGVIRVTRCGGSLIHPKAVLSAAHCFQGIVHDRVIVRAGMWHQSNANEYMAHQDRNAQKIIVHEDFVFQRGGNYRNDYAIVIGKSPFELAPHIGLVCLPDRMSAFDSSRCVATGWGGKPFPSAPNLPNVLKKIALPMVSSDTCRNKIIGLPTEPSFFCAGGVLGFDMCKGDSGSPFICPLINDPTRYVQVGIVGAGVPTCDMPIPGLYSNVTLVYDWILRKLADIDRDDNNDDMGVVLTSTSSPDELDTLDEFLVEIRSAQP